MQGLKCLGLAVLAAFAASASTRCDKLDEVGPFLYSQNEAVLLTFSVFRRDADAVTYNVSCAPPQGWSDATAVMAAPYMSLALTFDESSPLEMPGYLDISCTVISFGSASAPWCARSNSNCSVAPDPFWRGGAVHVVEVSHSDIGWLGVGMPSWGLPFPDLIDDTMNIALSLDMMRADPAFKWQHECMLFMRVFVEMYPDRESELVSRIAEGRFDIGGTFTEGLESTQLNELMARQMYSGRKWFVERYPALDSAVVSFHQDGPLRAIQAPQIWAKAGIRFLKSSRWSDAIVAWHGADDESSVLAMTEVHYGQASATVADIELRMQQLGPLYRDAGLPPQLVQALGTDYSPPSNFSALLGAWAAQGTGVAGIRYSTFHEALQALDVGAPGLKHVRGERPNLWYIEGSPPHHNIFTSLRDGARSLPAAELWSSFCALVFGGWSTDAFQYPTALLDAAWLNLTLNDHGIAGEPVPSNFSLPRWFVNENSPPQWDLVYADKWARASAAGDSIVVAAHAALAAALNVSTAPRGAIASIVVFNSLSWLVDGPAEVVMPAPCAPGDLDVTDAETDARVQSQRAFEDASGCTLVFTASGIPSLGYRAFYIAPASFAAPADSAANAAAAAPPPPGSSWTAPYTNSFFTVTPAAGGIASMVDLASGQELFDTSKLLAGEWISLEYTGMGASETREYAHAVKGASFERLSNMSTPALWSCVESGAARVVFATAPVKTNHSTVVLELALYSGVKRADLRVHLSGWDSAFGVANRVSFPIRTTARNVTYAAPFGVVRVGLDEAENSTDDVWLTSPGPDVPLFERAWQMHPREIADWMHADGEGSIGVLISSSVGAFDFVDCSGLYPPTQPVLAPEMLMHTDSNRGPFLPEPGDHHFLFSIVATAPGAGWRDGWRSGVQANNRLRATWRQLGAYASHAPAAWLPLHASLLSVEGDGGGSWVTAVKKQDEGAAGASPRHGLVVRLFNVDGVDRSEDVILSLDVPAAPSGGSGPGGSAVLGGASRVDLIELSPRDVPGVAGTSRVPLALGHWAVETLVLDAGL